jgi:predicted nucleic acid-binding protein
MTDQPSGPPSTVVLDTSALLRRYLADAERNLVLDAMAGADAWAACSLARTELQLALHLAAPTASAQRRLWAEVRDDWESFWEIPVDGRCLARASEIGARYGIGVTDAIHLAAADRLPKPITFVTFERQQIPAANELGFIVASPGVADR